MDKYYTPDISEFFVGFEFYIKDDKNIFTNHFVKEDIFCRTDLLKKYIKDNFYQIKYLDKEDIESLGFIVSSDYGASIEFKFQDRYKLVKVKHEGLTYSKNEIRIFENNSIFGEDYNSRLFIGNIKNKSELVKLLKQLGIG